MEIAILTSMNVLAIHVKMGADVQSLQINQVFLQTHIAASVAKDTAMDCVPTHSSAHTQISVKCWRVRETPLSLEIVMLMLMSAPVNHVQMGQLARILVQTQVFP